MKNLINFFEIKGGGDPDSIYYQKDEDSSEEWKSYSDDDATPFIMNLKTKKVYFGADGSTHGDILNDSKSQKEGIPELTEIYSGRASQLNPDWNCGRIFLDNEFLFIAWWKPLGKVFKETCDHVVKKFIDLWGLHKEFDGDYVAVTDNGKMEEFNTKSSKTVDIVQSDERKHKLQVIKAIHLATQEEKAEYFKAWKAEVAANKEKELQKLGIRDGTYAKRNHKFSKHIVKDEKTGKYKVVYGAHIGDSLQPNTLLNYINEEGNTPDKVSLGTKDENGIDQYLDACDVDARPFIIRYTREPKIWWGKKGNYHAELITHEMTDEEVLDCDIYRGSLFTNYKGKEKMNSGRVWYRNGKIFFTVWCPFGKDFNKFARLIVNDYVKKYDIKNFDGSFMAVNDNGELVEITDKTNVTVEQSDLRKNQVQKLRAIHLATQSEKKEFFKAWKAEVAELKEKELQKLGIRDGTYAKRNKLFSKHIVKDEVTGKHKVVYGAHIGDSLSVDTLLNYINEESED